MAPRNRATNTLLGILATIVVGWTLHVGAAILQPLVIALLLASMLQPIVRALARLKIPAFLTIIVLVGLLFLGILQLGVLVQAEMGRFLQQQSPTGEITLGQVLDGIDAQIRKVVRNPEVAEYLIRSRRDFDVRGLATDLIGTSFGLVKNLVLVLIYMLFIFAEAAIFRRKILSVAGRRRPETEEALDRIARGIQRYLGVKTIVSLATGACCYCSLYYLGIPQAALFGFLTFLLNYIPTFGSIIAGALATTTALAVEPTWHDAALVATTYLAVNLTLGSYLEPKILGRELDLSPLVVVICVVVWAGIWGVVGTFLAVPLTSALQIVLASHETTRPIAILLSSGPPREGWRTRLRALRGGESESEAVSDQEEPADA